MVSIFSEVGESALILKGPQGRINRAVWGPLNRTIISAGEDAVIRIWDSEVTIGYACIGNSEAFLLLALSFVFHSFQFADWQTT